VNYCSTCHHLAVILKAAIGELTDEGDISIPFTVYRGHRYTSASLLTEEFTAFEVGMRKALKVLKKKTATHFGLNGLAAFLRENEATHDSDNPSVINYGRLCQKQSTHTKQFKICGECVNDMEEVRSLIYEVMRGHVIPGSGGVVKYVCVEDLVSALEVAINNCKSLLTGSKKDGQFPDDFNPDDHRSVDATVYTIALLEE
jgi:hypothetical protein